ncbi:MAG: hypothetical protein KR126chlam1_00137 [Chlamydiae bacterium]|nr:hypothetical protein [Chlamydiota bacterium]
MKKRRKSSEQKALEIFQSKGGILRTSEALEAGIHPRTLYQLRDRNAIEQITRGLYGIAGLPEVSDPDLVIAAKKVPNGIICLISALYFHRLTSQIPHCVHIAIPQHIKAPKVDYPPMRFYWFSEKTWNAGIEEHEIGTTLVRCYSKEKTIIDCFKHREKIGIEVGIEALRNYWEKGQANLNEINKYAKISKVDKILNPYLEAIINEQS